MTIYVVSGLPRSGTSMMMLMLKKGGIEPFYDEDIKPNEANPNGFYETKKISSFYNNTYKEWMNEIDGKSIKVVSGLLKNIPLEYNYKVIFMNREIHEVVNSRKKLLEKNNKSQAEGYLLYKNRKIKEESRNFLIENNIPFYDIDYNKIMAGDYFELDNLNFFLNLNLDIIEMKTVPNQNLYRNRI